MEKQQESRSPEGNNEEVKIAGGGSRVRRFLEKMHKAFLGVAGGALLFGGTTGCNGGKPEVPKPFDGCVPVVAPEKSAIPPEIRELLGENAVRLQNPVVERHGKDIFLVDSDGQKLWRLVYGNALPWRKAEENRPFINEGVVYGTRVVVKHGGEVMEQLTTYGGRRIGPNGKPFVDTQWPRIWMADNRTVDDLKKRVEEKRARRREQEKQETVKEQPSRLLQIVSVTGKAFTDQRGVTWTHAGGYFPSLSPGRIYDATMRIENPQWGCDARGSDVLIGGTQILRWRVEGRGYVEFTAPVEQKK